MNRALVVQRLYHKIFSSARFCHGPLAVRCKVSRVGAGYAGGNMARSEGQYMRVTVSSEENVPCSSQPPGYDLTYFLSDIACVRAT